MRTYKKHILILESIAMVLSGWMGVGILMVLSYKKEARNVTTRLMGGVSFIHFIRALSMIFKELYTKQDCFCVLLASFRIFTNSLAIVFMLSFAVHLHLTFILSKPFKAKWEYGYWLGPILISLVALILLLCFHAIGSNSLSQECYYNTNHRLVHYLVFFTNFLPNTLCFVYFIIVIGWSSYKLKRKKNRLNLIRKEKVKIEKLKSNLSKLVTRHRLYLIIPILCYTPVYVFYVAVYMEKQNAILDFLSDVSLSMVGILNFICILLDPIFHQSVKEYFSK